MKTFKNNILLFGMSLFVGSMLTLSSCSSDDDDNNGGGGASSAGKENPLVKNGNVLLTSLERGDYGESESYTFTYDEQLRPLSAYYYYDDDEDDGFRFDYQTGKMSIYDQEGLSVSFNDKGYITKISGSWEDKGDGYVYRGKTTQIYKYDNNNHLVSFEESAEYHDEEDGEKWDEKSTSNLVLTWENNNLIKTETNSEFSGDDGTGKYNFVQTFTYSDKANKYRQFPGILGADFLLSLVGLCGVGPEKLPSAYASTELEEGIEYGKEYKYEYQHSWNIAYSLNENGSIDTETSTDEDGRTVKYKFNYASVDGYTPDKARASYSPYMSKTKTVGKGKKIRNLLKGRLIKPMRCR